MSINVTTDPRMGGCVLRYHTWPTIQRQTCAEHMWNVARILLAIWPDAPRHVVLRALFHDTGEVMSGDVPFPIKRDNPVLKREMDRIEEAAVLGMAIPWGLPAPESVATHGDPETHPHAIKLADLVEMWEFGLQEAVMGNLFAALIVERTGDTIATMCRECDERIAQRVHDYMARRLRAWEWGTEGRP